MRTYYITMKSPVGSLIWTFAALAMSYPDSQKQAARIVAGGKSCTCTIPVDLPKKPDSEASARLVGLQPLLNGHNGYQHGLN